MIRQISAPCIAILLLVNIFSWATPASAGVVEWSAETIPSRIDNILGPAGVDIRDFVIADDDMTMYAVPGNSISDNVVYRSLDTGFSWTVIDVPVTADRVAIAPDDQDIIVIGRNSTPVIYVTIDGGLNWSSLGTPQESGGAAMSALRAIGVSEASQGIHYVAAAGTDTAGHANAWYYNIGAASPVWLETKDLPGFSSGQEVAAVAFSPNFPSDTAMVVISEHDGSSVKLQVLDISAEDWNSNADYINFPCTVVSNAGITGLNAASLSLAPNYLGTNDDRRRVFIGLAVEGSSLAIATSGIYAFDDTIKTEVKTNVKIHSVAYNGSYLVAGRHDTNIVYCSTNPTATIPTVSTSTTTKCPGGEQRVIVTWISGIVYAGTSGNESAMAISEDNGNTFNDISLIDTAITFARDAAPSTSGSIVYLVTDDGNDLSLWRKYTTWQRVFSQRGTANYIVRIEPQSANVIYLAKKGAKTIYYNNSGGATQWLTRTCRINIQDLALESSSVLYALDAAGMVSKTSDAAITWTSEITTTLNSGATIVSVSTGTLLVGSQDGFVAYSTNSNLSWTRILEPLQTGAGSVQVIPDLNYGTNKYIFAASDTAGQNIKRWQVGTSTEWTDILQGTISGGIYGLATSGNKLYALEFNSTDNQSTLWLHISPATADRSSADWSFSPTTATTDIDDVKVHLNATPRALKVSTDKLWAVKTNGTNKLYSFGDVAMELTLRTPETGSTGSVNTINGLVNDIAFSWDRPSVATGYELQIARDEDFHVLLARVTISDDNDVVSAMVGPSRTGNNTAFFMPGTSYYWRVRVTEPIYSTFSVTNYFSIKPLSALVPELISPANGSPDRSRKPSFSWEPMAGITEYQFVLSDNSTMTQPVVDVKVDVTGFTMTQELEYGRTYFWRTRATRPVVSDWSILANFTVETEPSEPAPQLITVVPLPPKVIELPAPPPETIINVAPPLEPPPPTVPGYLRTVIIIASALLLIVVVLIIVPLPARFFPAPSYLSKPLTGPSRRARNIGKRLGKLWEELATRARELKPFTTQTSAPVEAGEVDTLSFAVKSFLFMTTSGEKEGGQRLLSAEEEKNLGRKLASGIKAVAGEEPLYLKYPEDAALFLQIWSRYGSRDETNRYLNKTFQSKPENAMALLKCYLAATGEPEAGAAGKKEFTRAHYDALTEVVEPDNVYAAIAKLYKFKLEKIEKEIPGDATDRAIAFQFLRIHHQVKGETEKPGQAAG